MMPGRLTLGLYNSYDPRRFSEAHRRALVRAAPLALAYDANLATFGFPYDDLAAHGGRTSENRSRGAEGRRGQGQAQQDAQAEPVELRTPAGIASYIAQTTSVAGAKGASSGKGPRGPGPSGRAPEDKTRRNASAHEGDVGHFVQLAQAGRFLVFELPKKGFPPQLGNVILTTEHAARAKATSARAIARELVDGKSQLLVFGLGPHGTPPEVRDVAAWELDVTGRSIGLETATAMGAVLGAIHAHVEALAAK